MRKFFMLAIIVAISLTSLFGQDTKIKRISITYEYVSVNPHETPEQAKQAAIEQAKTRALEENFGLDVFGMSSMLAHNRVEGESVTSSEDFVMLNDISVRGEWIETIKQTILEGPSFKDGFWHVKVYIEGRARNHSVEKAAIHYAIVNDVDDTAPRKHFRNGDDLFLRFSSPVAGSLCVYLVDTEGMAYCLLPYQSTQTGCQSIEANRDYILFSAQHDKQADEYTLNTQYGSEHNTLFIVFSPNQFTKAKDNQSGKNWQDEQLPRQLTYEELLKWLARNQTRDEQMIVRREIISIRK